jgi:dynein heavy chain
MPEDTRKEGEEETVTVVPADARVLWFEDKVCAALKLKNDKFKKLLSVGENVETIYQFLDKEHNTLIFYLNQKEDLIPAVQFPSLLKKKSIYFLKRQPGASVVDKLDTELILGDLPPNPLEFLSTTLEEVYLPLLSNPKNLENWPEVVANDVLRQFHQLNGAVCVISGKSKGKTMLPLPHGTKISAESDKTVLHNLETAVIDWTHQIKEVIRSDSASPLLLGLNPGPIVEIDFWAAKAANLNSIYRQLCDEKIQKISKILQASKSTYFPAFKVIFDEVVFGKAL